MVSFDTCTATSSTSCTSSPISKEVCSSFRTSTVPSLFTIYSTFGLLVCLLTGTLYSTVSGSMVVDTVLPKNSFKLSYFPFNEALLTTNSTSIFPFDLDVTFFTSGLKFTCFVILFSYFRLIISCIFPFVIEIIGYEWSFFV